MADVLFTNVRIFDGGGETPFQGEVLVQGNRISRVVKTGYGARSAPVAGAQVIDGAGAFLMPGMVEAMRCLKTASIALVSSNDSILLEPYFDYLVQGMQTSA